MPVSQLGGPKYKITIEMAANNAQPGDRPAVSMYRVGPDYTDLAVVEKEFDRLKNLGLHVQLSEERIVRSYM